MASVESGSHTISLRVMGRGVGGSLCHLYVDPVVPTDRFAAEGGHCSAGVGRRIGDCRLASFDCPLVWDGGLLSSRRSLLGQPQGLVVPPLLRDGELRVSGLLLQGLQETSTRDDHNVSLAMIGAKYENC